MRSALVTQLLCCFTAFGACAQANATREGVAPAVSPGESAATLARVFYWRARPGKLAEYNRYVHEVAEPIDREAQRQGAFISVTTFIARDTLAQWTHMRVFLLRDSTQLAGLSAALARAGERLEPDSAKRRIRADYSATLRDRVGDATLEVLR